MTSALVLGAGGTVGMAYHAGALRALEEVGGFTPNDADLIVGTSAGSMMGAMIRAGHTTEDLWLASLGEHPDIDLEAAEEDAGWTQAWRGPLDLIRRTFGSAYVMQRTMLRIPGPRLPQALRRAFPGGFYTIADADDRFSDVLPEGWPDKPLWLVAVDVRTGRRVVLGRRNPPRATLSDAVMASCAIPAFFQPIRTAGRTLVDGGVHSTTNLDLATKIKPDLIVAVVPMAFEPTASLAPMQRMMRNTAQQTLQREVAQARRRGARVLMIRPSTADLKAAGSNMMSREHDRGPEVTRTAYESTAALLRRPELRRLLDTPAEAG